MSKINEIKNKAKEKAGAAKEWLVDNKSEIAYYGVLTGIAVGGVVASKLHDKKYHNMWSNAKNAWENGNLDHDFGPYKVMKFFEPKTGEFIGETMCHERAMKSFLKLK